MIGFRKFQRMLQVFKNDLRKKMTSFWKH